MMRKFPALARADMSGTAGGKEPFKNSPRIMEPIECYRHSKLEEALLLCPGNDDQVRLSFQVYMDLCEAKTWHNVEIHHCKALNMMFVSARRGHGQTREIFLPTNVDDKMSPEDIQKYFNHLVLEGKQTESLTLAVCDCDTSTVYYKLSNTLQPPDPPEVSDDKKRKRHQKVQHRRQHLSNQTELFRIERERNNVSAPPCDIDDESS